MTNTELREQLKKLPEKPGIYLFRDNEKTLYIGKALNLKHRTANYLKTADPRLKRMVSESKKIDWIETDSDIEALILESQNIRIQRPDFNIMLRDDKQYFYIGFTKTEFPRLLLTHQPMDTDTDYVGPFTDGSALKSTLRVLRKIFPFCTCKQSHNNFCLNYHIGKCPGYCCLKHPEKSSQFAVNSSREYSRNIKAIKNILKGNKNSLIRQLGKEMQKYAKEEKYEKAIELQKKLEKLKRIFDNARLIKRYSDTGKDLTLLQESLGLEKVPERIECYDVANIQGKHATGAMVVFENGIPSKNQYRKFKIGLFGSATSKHHGGDTGMLREMLIRRFGHAEWRFPDLIVIDGGKGQLSAAQKAISNFQFPISNKIQNSIPIIALAKNEKHIGHKIILENGKEISLSRIPLSAKNLLLHIDAEAHRFAISYYRKLHQKKTFRS